MQFVFSCILLFLSVVLSVYLAFLIQKVIDSALLKSVKVLKRTLAITVGFMIVDLTLSLSAKHFSINYVQNTLEKIMYEKSLTFFYSSQFILALISINWVLTLSVALVSLLPAFVPSIFQGSYKIIKMSILRMQNNILVLQVNVYRQKEKFFLIINLTLLLKNIMT